MPALPLSELKKQLRDCLADNDFGLLFDDLKSRLPENSPKWRQLDEWKRQLNAANSAWRSGSLSRELLNGEISRISLGLLDFIGSLEESDFSDRPKSAPKTGKNGSILYRIPHKMQVGVEKRCVVRLAFDEAALLAKNDRTDEDIIDTIRVADEMEVFLIDPEGGEAFQIRTDNSARQFLEADYFTEWIFRVKPLREGSFPLILKVAVLEFAEGRERRREIVLEETVQVQALEPEPAAAVATDFQRAGYSFSFQSSTGQAGVSYEIPQPAAAPGPASRLPGGVRAMAFFLIFLVVGSTATFAITPQPTRDWWFTRLENSPEAYADYIRDYGADPKNQHVEKAYYRKAVKTDQPRDYRDYLEHQRTGEYKTEVTERLATLEIQAVESIEKEPELAKIEQFVADFGLSQRLPEVIAIVEKQPELAAQALPILEKAAISEVKRQPTAPQLKRFEQLFPKSEALPELKKTVEDAPVEPQKETEKLTGEAQKPLNNPSPNEPVSTEIPVESGQKQIEISGQPVSDQFDISSKTVSGSEEPVEIQKEEEAKPAAAPPAEIPKDRAAILAEIKKNMVRVEGGSFDMGCKTGRDKNCNKDELPLRENLPVKSFSISKYELTQAQWRAVTGENPSSNKGCDQCPVERVSWDDVQVFLKELNKLTGENYRLPSEAEWEFAARGGMKTGGFEYAGSNILKEVGWFSDNSGGETHPVGGLKPNELGLFDMSGNVREWCQDSWHWSYEGAPTSSTVWSGTDGSRVYRGGSWDGISANCRSAFRNCGSPTSSNYFLGLRLARQ